MLVEIKYAPDPDLNGAVRQQAKDQHKDLRILLLAEGWGTVNLYPVIIGNAGTITNTANDAFQALGVDAAARMTLLKRLASTACAGQLRSGSQDLANAQAAAPRHALYHRRCRRATQMRPAQLTRMYNRTTPRPTLLWRSTLMSQMNINPALTLCQTLNTCRGKSSPGVELDAQEQMPLQGQARSPKRCCMSRLDHRHGAATGSQYWRARAKTSCGPSLRMLSQHVAPAIHLSPLRMRLLRPAHASYRSPQPSLTSEPNAPNGAAAPQPTLTPDDDRAHIASQPIRSERIRANTLSQQRPLLRRRDVATSQLRRSTRLQTMSQPQQQQPINIVSTAPLQAAPSHLLTQLSHMAPKPSLKRKLTVAFHMTLRRPAMRRCTEQPSLQHAHIMESADERPSHTCPHSSSGQPFDPG